MTSIHNEDLVEDPRNYEPDCTCTRTDVDMYDVSTCELCDPRSAWRRDCAAWDRKETVALSSWVLPLDVPRGIFTDEDCPF